MALVKGRTERRDIPHESGEWMEFRVLSGRQLREAQIEAQNEIRQGMRAMGPELFRAQLETLNEQSSERVERVARDPRHSYDKDTVLKRGIIGWSYDAPVSVENISELDTETEDWAFDEILKIAGIELEGEAEKNDSRASTDTSLPSMDGTTPATIGVSHGNGSSV